MDEIELKKYSNPNLFDNIVHKTFGYWSSTEYEHGEIEITGDYSITGQSTLAIQNSFVEISKFDKEKGAFSITKDHINFMTQGNEKLFHLEHNNSTYFFTIDSEKNMTAAAKIEDVTFANKEEMEGIKISDGVTKGLVSFSENPYSREYKGKNTGKIVDYIEDKIANGGVVKVKTVDKSTGTIDLDEAIKAAAGLAEVEVEKEGKSFTPNNTDKTHQIS